MLAITATTAMLIKLVLKCMLGYYSCNDGDGDDNDYDDDKSGTMLVEQMIKLMLCMRE